MDPNNPTPNEPAAPVEGGAFAAAAAGAPQGNPPPAAAEPPLLERIPEKYRVAKEDGSVDLELSTAKLLEGHAELQKRFGAGDVPPKTPDEYAPKVEGLDFEELKTDEKYQGFLKGCHAKGLTNAQVEFVLGEYAARQGDDASASVLGMDNDAFAEAVKGDAAAFGGYEKFMGSAMRTLRTYGGDLTAEELATIPNSPIVAKVLAAIGKELPEDTGTPRGGKIDTADWDMQVAQIRASEAHIKPSHPEHEAAKAKLKALYEKRYPNK